MHVLENDPSTELNPNQWNWELENRSRAQIERKSMFQPVI